MIISGIFVNGPYGLITTAVSANLVSFFFFFFFNERNAKSWNIAYVSLCCDRNMNDVISTGKKCLVETRGGAECFHAFRICFIK